MLWITAQMLMGATMCNCLSDYLTLLKISHKKIEFDLTQNGLQFEIKKKIIHCAVQIKLDGIFFGDNQVFISIGCFGFWDLEEPFFELAPIYFSNDKKIFIDIPRCWRTENLSEIVELIDEIKAEISK
jgi:hypothetical protein